MKRYKLYLERLERISETSLHQVAGGFNIVKISQKEALLVKNSKSVGTFEETLSINGIFSRSYLQPDEQYYGYIALWRGFDFQIYKMMGYAHLATEDEMRHSMNSQAKEFAKAGTLLTGEFNFWLVGTPCIEGLMSDDLQSRFRRAIETETYEISMTDEEREGLRHWYNPNFNEALVLLEE